MLISFVTVLGIRVSMSWWDAKGLTSLATQALKTAQKKIDKVLDIKEEDEEPTETFQGEFISRIYICVKHCCECNDYF
jgi:hypothetical protein